MGFVCLVAFDIDVFLDFRDSINRLLFLLIFERQELPLFSGCLAIYLYVASGSL
jgi:hypothetical protein